MFYGATRLLQECLARADCNARSLPYKRTGSVSSEETTLIIEDEREIIMEDQLLSPINCFLLADFPQGCSEAGGVRRGRPQAVCRH